MAERKGNVMFKTIAPKILEAIARRTAPVLFPSYFNGILEAGTHYIPLQPNDSNVSEVVQKLRDDTFLADMVDRRMRRLGPDLILSCPFMPGRSLP